MRLNTSECVGKQKLFVLFKILNKRGSCIALRWSISNLLVWSMIIFNFLISCSRNQKENKTKTLVTITPNGWMLWWSKSCGETFFHIYKLKCMTEASQNKNKCKKRTVILSVGIPFLEICGVIHLLCSIMSQPVGWHCINVLHLK